MDSKETPAEKRERLKQKELKNNPSGSLNDAFNSGNSGNLTGMNVKDIGILILVLFFGYLIYKIIFNE
ncbi:DUF6366 family protein [Lysinibacillus parviboronicapiens]|uniref:DUF6366 family protein n=1 Tax=Lysinibacillus parviboronicapiens TaxID=436516 RepID=UPI000D3BB338|nr:DUF6366 family protein [Lysinibacillus parviboronicapiens]